MPTNVKTAISLRQDLYNRVSEVAKEMKVSRSKVFALAVEEYIQKIDSEKLLQQINAAYSEDTAEESRLRKKINHKHKEILERDKW